MKAKRQIATGFDPALWAWEQNERTTGTTKWVLVSLCKYADANGSNCYPSLARLAADTNLAERTVRLALRSLEDAGYIAVEHRGHVLTSMYRLPLYEQYLRRRGEADAPQNRSDEGNYVPLTEGNDMPPSMPDEGHMATVRGEYKGRQGGNTCPLPSSTFQGPSKEIGATSLASDADEQPKSHQRRSRIDPNWRPDQAGIDYAQQAAIADVEAELDKFRDHHLAKGSTMVDWTAAWRTWCRNARRFAGARSSSGAKRPQVERGETLHAGRSSKDAHFLCLNDDEEAWAAIADRRPDGTVMVEKDREGRPQFVVGGGYIRVVFYDLLEMAGLLDHGARYDLRIVCEWLRAGIHVGTIDKAIRKVVRRSTYERPNSLRYFDAAVREAAQHKREF